MSHKQQGARGKQQAVRSKGEKETPHCSLLTAHPGGLSQGVLIALEGIDGAGKTTQAQLLKDFLRQKGFEVVCFKEPTPGPWGRKIAEIARWGRKGISAQEEMELFLRDREEDVRDNILPALRENKIVIMDRYYYSSIAYQGALGLDPNEIKEINEQRFPKPDLVFILTIPPAEGIKRILSRGQGSGIRGPQRSPAYEEETYLTRVAKIFHELAKNKEQRTKNKEQRTKNKEQRTKSYEPSAKGLLEPPSTHCLLIDGMRQINIVHQEIAPSVLDRLSPLMRCSCP